MPNYEFKCNNCEEVFEALTSYDETNKYSKIKCPNCGSKKKEKLMTSFNFNFSDPVGTDRFENSHDYRFKHKLPKVKEERANAERKSHVGKKPYNDINDTNFDIK